DLMYPASRSGSRDRPRKSFVSQQPGFSVIRRWRLLDELECLVDEDLAGQFAQRGPRDVVVTWKAPEIDLGEDVAERVVGQAEEEVLRPVHLALEVEADVGQGLAGDGQDLRGAQVHQVDPRGDRSIVVVRV